MLSAIVFIPLIAAVGLLFVAKENLSLIRNVAVGAVLLSFLLSLYLLAGFDETVPGMQFVQSFAWVPMLNINFLVGVDGISLWLLILTTALSVIAVCFSFKQENLRNFLALMLALEAGTLGVFVALDTILFYVFWELMLIPTYFLIGLWGEGKRVYATLKFVLYTLVGSLLMLVAIVALTIVHYNATHDLSFDIRTLTQTHIPVDMQGWMFFFFFLAFAVKVPIFPFHSWLPHAYVSSPIPVLILLTGVMSKTGAYGLIRFCLPLFPESVESLGWLIGFGAAIGIVYGAWIAIAQKDIKALVTYSSISHLGFIALGIFARTSQGIEGSVLQMINHGIIASALFIIVGILEQKLGTRNLDELRGLRKAMPILCGMFMLIVLAALGLPGLNGFVGEFLILMGVWTSHTLAGYSTLFVWMAGLAIVFAAIYMLYMFQGAMHEENQKLPEQLTDINRSQIGMLLPACILIVLIGLYPQPFLDRVSASVKHVMTIEKTINLPSKDEGGEHH